MTLAVLVGACLGLVLGACVWLAARRLSLSRESGRQAVVGEAGGSPTWPAAGSVPLLAAVVQAAMAAWGAYVCWKASDVRQVVIALLITGVLLTISLVDAWTRRIPNLSVLVLLVWAPLQMFWLGRPTPTGALLGLLLAGGLFLLIALITRGALGAGDVKLAAALGAGLGYPLVVPALFYAVVAAGLGGCVLLVTRRARLKDYMAYGPYLALGGWLVWTRWLGLWP